MMAAWQHVVRPLVVLLLLLSSVIVDSFQARCNGRSAFRLAIASSSSDEMLLPEPLVVEAVVDETIVDGQSAGESFRAPKSEIDRRRNFAIISHPDAGKTTLTEKLLLFGGAIQDAGAVKARAVCK
jgi:hypothetical protein